MSIRALTLRDGAYILSYDRQSYGLYHMWLANTDRVPLPDPSPLLAPASLGHGREVERWAAVGGPFTDGCRYSATLG